MKNCIINHLTDKTRILVTHAIQYCNRADRIIYMNKGEIKWMGTYQEIKEQDFCKYYDELKNINNAFFHNYYCHINNTYKTIREYRNKVEVETFDKETDAIYWCSDFDITKEQILSNDIRPFDLNEKVYNYDF